jgi:hypothetical protein
MPRAPGQEPSAGRPSDGHRNELGGPHARRGLDELGHRHRRWAPEVAVGFENQDVIPFGCRCDRAEQVVAHAISLDPRRDGRPSVEVQPLQRPAVARGAHRWPESTGHLGSQGCGVCSAEQAVSIHAQHGNADGTTEEARSVLDVEPILTCHTRRTRHSKSRRCDPPRARTYITIDRRRRSPRPLPSRRRLRNDALPAPSVLRSTISSARLLAEYLPCAGRPTPWSFPDNDDRLCVTGSVTSECADARVHSASARGGSTTAKRWPCSH